MDTEREPHAARSGHARAALRYVPGQQAVPTQMRAYGQHWLKTSVAEKLRSASRSAIFYGKLDFAGSTYLEDCKAFHAATGTLIIFTRDAGHHTSGWFKNPDYERCLHLSISFHEPFDLSKQAEFSESLAQEWCDCFFGGNTRLIWEESAKSSEGKKVEVRHYRVFCDHNWQPFLPKGEVYSTELTEIGWKSWSEQYPEDDRKEPSSLHAG